MELNQNNGLNTLQPKDTAIAENGKEKKLTVSDMLPDNMLQVVTTQTDVLQWESDYCILPMIVTAAAAIGNARNTEIAGYTVHSILYGCMVGNPSVNKSEPLKFAVKPLRRLFAEQYATYQTEYAAWNELPESERKGSEPRLAETVFSDITIEKVAYNLQFNPKGALLAVDELKGLLNTFYRQKGSNAEQKYTELFNCTPLTDSRMSRKTVYVPAPYLSIIGTTQPDVLHRTFSNAVDNGFKERLLTVYPDAKPKAWNENANKEERKAAQAAWEAIIQPLHDLQAVKNEDGTESPVHIPFSKDAREQLYMWQSYNTERKTNFPEQAAMLGKADIICPRLALILALIAYPDTEFISETDAIRAINLMEHFIQHSKRVMQLIKEGVPDKPNPKQMLFTGLPNEFTTQEAYIKAAQMGISKSTCKRYLNDQNFCKQKRHGLYEKII